ncbi:hypothetical protein BCR32DRAFT_287404 [Anaeromyces robustus]|uniref:Uncharacterized protein n=1 Tax=Anaeromyces robustus TaxID=1754192 RepID=A0A1Y1VRS1_9FUNG|nr:hypothetical protein BCR32DRAFT_287404 [Anaeromyces robustus]|eukprot:ORX63980.1 hypothetical protein BCR32DRAFT_287404 [Anaeromyces robustus]
MMKKHRCNLCLPISYEEKNIHIFNMYLLLLCIQENPHVGYVQMVLKSFLDKTV